MNSRKSRKNDNVCPVCDEDVLEILTCKNCTKEFLMCEECETIFKDQGFISDPESRSSSLECPHCSFSI